MAASEKEGQAKTASMMSGKPISTTLNVLSKLTGALTAVPEYGAIAGAASWVAKALAGAAEAWGYSRPDGSFVNTTSIVSSIQTATANGNDIVVPLGVFNEDSMKMMNPGGTKLDELALDAVLTPFFNWTQFNWTNQASGTVLFSMQLAPQGFTNAYTDPAVGGKAYKSSGMVSFLAHLFTLWRGGYRVRFRLYKTKYHSGSLYIAFFPGFITSPPTYSQSQFVNRVLWDVQSGSSLEVGVPYTSQNTYSLVSDSPGLLVVYVNNPLTNPNTVTQNVAISVDVSCAPGFEFAAPVENTNSLVVYSCGALGEEQEEDEQVPKRISKALKLKEREPDPDEDSWWEKRKNESRRSLGISSASIPRK